MKDAPQMEEAPVDPHATCRQQMTDIEAKWKRAVADYQNREKELAREREDFARFCTVDIIRDFLPIVDAAEAASRQPQATSPHPPTPPLPKGSGEIKMNFSPSHRDGSPPARGGARGGGSGEREGVGAIRQLCLDLLKRHGVEPIGAIGDRVDYLLHEVVDTKQVPKDFSPSHREGEREGVGQEKNVPGTILEVVQVGYTMHGKLLRPAKVIVCEEKQ